MSVDVLSSGVAVWRDVACVWGMGDSRSWNTGLGLGFQLPRSSGLPGRSGMGKKKRRTCLSLSFSGSNLFGFLPHALSRNQERYPGGE